MREEEIIQWIDRYCRGELSVGEADRLWEELVRNPRYMKLMEAEIAARRYFEPEVSGVDSPMQIASGSQTREKEVADRTGESGSFTYGSGAWVAGAAVLVILLALFHLFSEETAEPLMTEQVVTTIDLEQMATPKLMRSSDSGEGYDPLDVEINRGYKLAISGDTEASKSMFRELLDNPSDLSPSQKAMSGLNYGILLYNEARFEEALEVFELVSQEDEERIGPNLAGKGWWYKGKTQVKLNAYLQARQSILYAMHLNQAYAARGDELLPGLERKIARQR